MSEVRGYKVFNPDWTCKSFQYQGLGNTGYKNIGYYNTGSENNGNKNNGHRNYGDHNSGHYNIGNHNSGNFNIGDYNTGDCNEGKYNSGDSNNGNFNTGDLNTTNYSNGCFNTVEPNIYLFNKLSNWTLYDWRTSEAHKILQRIRQYPRDWKIKDLVTKEEMIQIRQQRWNQLDKKEKEVIMSIPNFDKNIFKEITGIDVEWQ